MKKNGRKLSPSRIKRTAEFRKNAIEIRAAFSKEEAELIIDAMLSGRSRDEAVQWFNSVYYPD